MSATRPKSTRPRNRKQQIIAAASDQFRVSGYHNVGMADIAEAVGISGPALYRHFSGKNAILHAALVATIDEGAAAFVREYADLPEMLDAFAAMLLERREAGVLSERILANLPSEDRQELRERYVASVAPLRESIARSRPDLAPDGVELLMRATLAAFGAMRASAGKLDPARAHRLMVEVGTTICRIDTLPVRAAGSGEVRPAPRDRLLPTSRREAVLAAATRLFAARGYEAVGMEDIAAAAGGMAGPSLYHHFSSKSAILVAALTRCLESMLFDMSAALNLSDDSTQALDAALESFVRINFEHGAALTTLLHDVVNVPPEEREIVRRGQLDYLSEWAALLADHRADLTLSDARLVAQAVHSVVSALGQRNRVWMRPAYRDEITALGRAMLGLPVPDPSS